MEAMLPARDVPIFYIKFHGACIYNIGVNGRFSTSIFEPMAIIKVVYIFRTGVIVMRVSPGKVCPHTYITRDVCVSSVIHVPRTHFTRDACFLDCNAATHSSGYLTG